MTPWVVGIDPGLYGAIALLEPSGKVSLLCKFPLVAVAVNKRMRQRFNVPIIASTFSEMTKVVEAAGGRLVVYMEEVHSMPGNGGVQDFAFGRGFGQLEGIIASFKLPMTLISPKEWKAYMIAKQIAVPKLSQEHSKIVSRKQKDKMRRNMVKARKSASIEAATRLFPEFAETFSATNGDGAAEALLLAEWGRRRETSGSMPKPSQEKVIVSIPEVDAIIKGTPEE